MDTKINCGTANEVKDRRNSNIADKWVTIELNENNVDDLDNGTPVIATGYLGARYLIIKVR